MELDPGQYSLHVNAFHNGGQLVESVSMNLTGGHVQSAIVAIDGEALVVRTVSDLLRYVHNMLLNTIYYKVLTNVTIPNGEKAGIA